MNIKIAVIPLIYDLENLALGQRDLKVGERNGEEEMA